jgi:uncharacterized damage-inducible protein DinB
MYPTIESRADILKMLEELSENRQKIFAACEALSPEQLQDPVYAGTWTVPKNLQHLAWAEAYMLGWILKRPGEFASGDWPKEPAADLPSLRKAFDEAHAAVIAFLKANPESVLKEPCLYGRGKTNQTVGGVLFHLIEHEIHHRAFVVNKLAKLRGKA